MNAPNFEAFWSAWPKNGGRYSRKGGKAACLVVWNKRYHFTQAETIIKHVEWLKTTEAWLKDSGAYIPAPLVYLNQQRWDGAEIPDQPITQPHEPNDWLQEHTRHMSTPTDEEKAKQAIARMGELRKQLRGNT